MANKALFIHDGPLRVSESGSFHSIMLTNQVIERYKYLAEDLRFLMRSKQVNDKVASKMSKLEIAPDKVYVLSNYKQLSNLLSGNVELEESLNIAIKEVDFIIARLPSYAASKALPIARKHNKPVLSEIVACNWDSLWNYSLKGKLVAPYFYYRQKNYIKNLEYSIYVTQKFLQHRYPTNGNFIGCSDVELEGLDEKILEARLEKLNQYDTSKPLKIGTIGAVDVPYKGQDIVIRSLNELNIKFGEVHYYLLGQGDHGRLTAVAKQSGCEDRVHLMGTRSHEEVFHFLDDLDIYVHPSKQEGLPRALIEALSRACPAIGTNIAGIPELLPPKRLFNKNSQSGFIDSFASLMNSDLKEEAIANFNKAKEYNMDYLDKKRYLFYHKFLSENNLEIPQKLSEKID